MSPETSTDVAIREWSRATVKAAYAIWARLHATGREPRQFGDLDQDTLDDLCIQAQHAAQAYMAAASTRVTFPESGVTAFTFYVRECDVSAGRTDTDQ
jgi:hypothetical protein